MRSKYKFSLAAIAFLAAGGGALADETYTLEPVVISATGYEQEVKHAPASISIIPQEEFLNKPIRDLGDIVQEVPGINTTTEKTGGQNISIRGMSSSYTLILVDGKRVNMSKGFDSNGFDATSGFLPPASMIERVEVIRGPASTLYGSDAMGGVINIITKKVPDEVSASVGMETRLQEHHDTWGNTYGINGNIFAPIGERFSVNLRGKYNYGEKNRFYWRDISGYTPSKASALANPYTSHSPTGYINASVGARFNFILDEQNSFYFDADYGFQRLGSLNTSSDNVTAIRDYHKQNFVLNHDGDYSFGRFNNFVQFTSNQRIPHEEVAIGASKGKPNHANLTYNPAFTYQSTFTKNFEAAILNSGVYYFHERLYTRSNGNDKQAYQIAIFAESENFLNDYLSTTGGARINYTQTYGAYTTPRFYVNLYPSSWLTFKAGVASGFQVPELSTRYDGLYDISTSRSSTIYKYGNANLQPEKTFNYEISSIINSPVANFTLTGYVTEFTDAIKTKSYNDGEAIPNYGTCGAGAGATCSMPVNVDKARLYGLEFGLNSSPFITELTRGFHFDFSYAYTKTKQLTGEYKGDALNDIPTHNLSAKVSFKKSALNTYLRYIGKYKTPTDNAHIANAGPGKYYKDLHLVDLGVNYTIAKTFTIGLVVNNLFDFDTIDYFIYPSGTRGLSYSNAYQRMVPGRNYWLNIRADF